MGRVSGGSSAAVEELLDDADGGDGVTLYGRTGGGMRSCGDGGGIGADVPVLTCLPLTSVSFRCSNGRRAMGGGTYSTALCGGPESVGPDLVEPTFRTNILTQRTL